LNTRPHCFRLFAQEALRAASRARARAGSSIAASIPIIAITTSSSINVNPERCPLIVTIPSCSSAESIDLVTCQLYLSTGKLKRSAWTSPPQRTVPSLSFTRALLDAALNISAHRQPTYARPARREKLSGATCMQKLRPPASIPPYMFSGQRRLCRNAPRDRYEQSESALARQAPVALTAARIWRLLCHRPKDCIILVSAQNSGSRPAPVLCTMYADSIARVRCVVKR
jgi:hypothetical protein